ncbi:hypothetical protein BDQ94DRAFT_139748 [Aspergillus welwitschiae]|uniref:Uncharacterized protein n=1 Tax=Aspergillus welwitschiae TaxID=1341132 RepID=A0A3F3Q8U3_9EURO|nr:hypothetical protein BDQ94DRAFT_139748 [Aspergillus welwitschiae]RDH35539.1 hypothetical protein BDQ94DRAFT_139748 [Aspergillus welwitschiae]
MSDHETPNWPRRNGELYLVLISHPAGFRGLVLIFSMLVQVQVERGFGVWVSLVFGVVGSKSCGWWMGNVRWW